jgi:hypothetical protein
VLPVRRRQIAVYWNIERRESISSFVDELLLQIKNPFLRSQFRLFHVWLRKKVAAMNKMV